MTHLPHTHWMSKVALLSACVMLLGALVLTGCSTVVGARAVEKYNQHPLTVGIPSALSPQEVEDVMVESLRYRGWTVVHRSPQEVIGERDRVNFKAKAILKVNGLIKILSDSSFRRSSGSSGGETLEPGIPKGWLRNLQKDLETGLARKAAQK
ncbi:MAG: hypothetical protein AB7N91_14310 [Candidatus Tectimicrobiota bacterium]